MLHRRLVPVLVAAALPAAVSAQGTITDDDVSFVRTTGAFDSSPTANLTGATDLALTTDHLFEFGWWIRRVGVDAAESPFPVPTTESYVGATSTLTWSDVPAGSGISAIEVATVLDPGLPGVGDGAEVEITLTLQNESASSVTVALFAMADFDLAGTFGNDSAQIVLPPRFMSLTDGSVRAQFYGALADAHLVRLYGASDVGAVLSDGSATTFDSSGLPFGPGDFTGGYQWTFTLAASKSKEVTVVLAVDHSIFCDGGGGRSLFCGDFEAKPLLGWSAIEPASCTGFCASGNPTAAACYCDSLCLELGDCCVDACLTCGRCLPF